MNDINLNPGSEAAEDAARHARAIFAARVAVYGGAPAAQLAAAVSAALNVHPNVLRDRSAYLIAALAAAVGSIAEKPQWAAMSAAARAEVICRGFESEGLTF